MSCARNANTKICGPIWYPMNTKMWEVIGMWGLPDRVEKYKTLDEARAALAQQGYGNEIVRVRCSSVWTVERVEDK